MVSSKRLPLALLSRIARDFQLLLLMSLMWALVPGSEAVQGITKDAQTVSKLIII